MISEANINYYATPLVHPRRKMNEHDFIYLLEGEWKIGQNGEEYVLKKDSMLVLTAENTHFGVTACPAGTKTMYFHVSCGPGEVLANPETREQDKLYLPPLTNAANNKRIKKLFAEIVDAKLSQAQRKSDLYFELLLCELWENNIYTSGTDTAMRIKNIIHNHPEKFFLNTELAAMTNVSVKSAETKFKAMFGKTIHQYTLAFKMKEAISYFEVFPELSIKEIAFNLGFYDEYHFSKQFKRYLGISPQVYKRQTISEQGINPSYPSRAQQIR